MEEFGTTNEMGQAKRPMFLTVLCVLTFISAGLGSFGSLIIPLIAEQIIEFFKTAPNYDEAQFAGLIAMLNAGWGYYLTICLLSVLSLIGAILMWKLNKLGFHIYALSNLAALFVPMLMFASPISWSGIITTSCFIVLYALNLKEMK